jgi:hypothetical protein
VICGTLVAGLQSLLWAQHTRVTLAGIDATIISPV